nr:hypothetical protein [uncultured Anaerotignum sp.]
MKKEKPTTKTCKHCKAEIPIDENVCPNCSKKQSKGRLIATIAVVVVIAVLAMPFGGSDDAGKNESKQTGTTQANTKNNKTPSETDIQKAIDTDSTIFGLVETSENLIDTLLIAVSDTQSGTTTTLDVYDMSEDVRYSQHNLSSQLPKKDGINDDYVDAAENYILNSMMIARDMHAYLDKNKMDDLSDYKKRVESRQSYTLSVVSARMAYLSAASVPEDKINEIFGTNSDAE